MSVTVPPLIVDPPRCYSLYCLLFSAANSTTCTFVFNECTYTYYVQIGEMGMKPKIHISEDIQCPLGGIPGWIFAVAAVGAILLLGLLALFLIKLCFVILV